MKDPLEVDPLVQLELGQLDVKGAAGCFGGLEHISQASLGQSALQVGHAVPPVRQDDHHVDFPSLGTGEQVTI